MVCPIIQQDEFHIIAVHDPDKTSSIAHVLEFVHCKVSAESLAKVQVEVSFISAQARTAKCDWVKGPITLFGEKVEAVS